MTNIQNSKKQLNVKPTFLQAIAYCPGFGTVLSLFRELLNLHVPPRAHYSIMATDGCKVVNTRFSECDEDFVRVSHLFRFGQVGKWSIFFFLGKPSRWLGTTLGGVGGISSYNALKVVDLLENGCLRWRPPLKFNEN